jgi:uncharacterized protein (DUF2235 family)
MKKRVVVCIDGTWNAPEINDPERNHPTNVLRLVRAIRPKDDSGTPQVVEYVPGVGTKNWLERWVGGATGWGISWNIQRAYEFIVNNYLPDEDDLYLFGFSRGAYAIRSLSGFIYKFGYIPKHEMYKFTSAWRLYQESPEESPQDLARRAGLENPGRYSEEGRIPILFLGVWDTVGSLGPPTPLLRRLMWRRFSFHSTELTRNVRYAYQALALHEIRKDFRPSLWMKKWAHQEVRQVWFPGSHSDIGGGLDNRGLSDISLSWMMDRAEECHLRFDWKFLELQPNAGQAIGQPWQSSIWWMFGPESRGIPITGGQEQCGHRSILERLNTNKQDYPVAMWCDPRAHERDALKIVDAQSSALPIEPTAEREKERLEAERKCFIEDFSRRGTVLQKSIRSAQVIRPRPIAGTRPAKEFSTPPDVNRTEVEREVNRLLALSPAERTAMLDSLCSMLRGNGPRHDVTLSILVEFRSELSGEAKVELNRAIASQPKNS